MERSQSGERPERDPHAHRHDQSGRDRLAHQHRHGQRAVRGERHQLRQQRRHGTDTIPAADLAVTMTDGTTTVVPGTSNPSSPTRRSSDLSTVSSLTLTDTIPAALLNPNFAPSVGAYDTNTGVWSGLSLDRKSVV